MQSIKLFKKDPGNYGVVLLFGVLAGFCVVFFCILQGYSPQWQPYFKEKAKFDRYNIAKEQFRQRETDWIHKRMKQL